MPAAITPNGKPAERTNLDGLYFVFSTTHPLTKEQVYVLYHDDGSPV